MSKEKVLVTGATGFIGSHLVQELVERDYDVYTLERYVTGRYILGQMRSVKTFFGNLKNHFTIRKIIHELHPDRVIHLAAISPVAYSYDHPNEVIETNLIGTINLAEACLREIPYLRQFLFASTSETYGNGPSPKTEETPQNPNSPYAVSKFACEKYLLYMQEAHDFPVTILRNFNTYGRKNNAHFVVERTITQTLQEETIRLGDPTPIRDLLYVNDHVNSYLTCLNNPKVVGEIFNFCTGKGTSIEQLVELICELTSSDSEIIWNTIPARPLDIKELIGDYSKAKRLLAWKPQFTLEEGLRSTIDLWRARARKHNLKHRKQ